MTTPTEYFGPHAKRWTNPDTGVTYSLKPRDYHQLVAEQKAKAEAEAAAPREPQPLEHLIIEDATPEKLERALADAGWPNVISMDTMYDRDLEPEAGLLSYAGLILDGDGYRKITEAETRAANEAYPVERGTIRFLSLTEDDTFGLISPVEQRQPAGRHWRHRRPQRIARWFAKFGRRPRLWMATGLVYIIAIIGVIAVTGVMS